MVLLCSYKKWSIKFDFDSYWNSAPIVYHEKGPSLLHNTKQKSVVLEEKRQGSLTWVSHDNFVVVVLLILCCI